MQHLGRPVPTRPTSSVPFPELSFSAILRQSPLDPVDATDRELLLQALALEAESLEVLGGHFYSLLLAEEP